MSESILSQAKQLGKDYFTGADMLSALDRCLEQFPVSDQTWFVHLTQKKDLPQLEVGYISRRLLIDFTYQADSQKITLVPIGEIKVLVLSKGTDSTTFNLQSSEGGLSYTALVGSKRTDLEQYWLTVSRLIQRHVN